MMTEMILPKALMAMRTLSALVEFFDPNTELKKSDAASSLEALRDPFGTNDFSLALPKVRIDESSTCCKVCYVAKNVKYSNDDKGSWASFFKDFNGVLLRN